MAKNKGGREVRKPKQIKKPTSAPSTLQALSTDRTNKPRPAK